MAVLGLSSCARAFSSCGKQRPLFIAVRRPLTSRPLLLRSTGSRRAGSVIVAHGPSCSAACGIFPDQGSNLCPLHWQAVSQPLRHQGSPNVQFFKYKNGEIFRQSQLSWLVAELGQEAPRQETVILCHMTWHVFPFKNVLSYLMTEIFILSG